MNLNFYLLVSGVNQVDWGRNVAPRFSFVTKGVSEPAFTPTLKKEAYFSACGVFVDD